MRALLTSPPGGWVNTHLTDVDLRAKKPFEVLVQIHAVGLNPADNFQIEGRYPGGPKPPFIPGRDACGVVLRADPSSRWRPGDHVVTLQTSTTDLTSGTLCEEQWFAAENLASKPNDWSPAEAAAAPLVFLTAWKALVDIGCLRRGDAVVVTGASGGVGLAAVQLGLAIGAKVVALSRSVPKQQRLRDIGAQYVFSPDNPHLKEQICDVLRTKGVPLVVDTVGGSSLTTAVHLLGLHGRVSVVGVLAGVEATIPIPALMFKRASIHGVLVTDDSPDKAQAAWKQICDLMQKSAVRPILDSTFSLESVKSAFEKLGGDVFGKVVVEMPSFPL